MSDTSSGPVVLTGYAGAVLHALSEFLPDDSMVFVEEPDVVRKRHVHDAVAGSPKVRAVVEWEYQRDGAADRFAVAHPDLAPSAVVPISEYSVPFAARLAERYGVPGAGLGAALLLRDKHLLRQVTAEAGIANPRSVEVGGPADVRAFLAETGGPIVLKPANRQGALGTMIVHPVDDVDAAWAACLDQDEGVMQPDRGLPLRMLAERFVRGVEYSVEMMWAAGEVGFAGVTRKYLFDGPRPIELGHVHPADIPAGLRDRLVGDTARVLRAVGMHSGFVHCEWIVEDGVPHLVECAGRMAGDGIIELAQLAWRHTVVEQHYAMMRGLPWSTGPASPPAFAAAWTGHGSEGEVESVDGLEDAAAAPGVRVALPAFHVGQRVGELRCSWDRTCLVIAEGATAGEALERARHGVELIAIKVRPAM